MKKILLIVFGIYLSGIPPLFAQQDQPDKVFRAYWDNDFFNIRGQGTDEAYTNGLRFDFFYEKPKHSSFFLDKIFPSAGDSSVNVRGWGLTQVMITPKDLTKSDYQPGDYPYAGALFGTRSFYSYNPIKKYSFQTEFLFGVRGPESFAAQTQKFIHYIIKDKQPMGWNNQVGTKLILNLNFIAEKELAHYRNSIEVIGGGQAYAGSILNGFSAYGMVRIGKMTPYFNGYVSQHSTQKKGVSGKNRLQAYLIIRPSAGLIFSNELVSDRGINRSPEIAKTELPIENWDLRIDYGVVIASGRVSFSFIQKSMSPMLKGLPNHEVGNLSLYYSW